ncbi:hypothetical protein [Microcoleus sp. FACHB-672]|uniref:hypothetical protein n=1 Tax=Microcoleus sp. FACHB-672 TaxID=2692825 RepID=UPI0016821EB5|nr:hypothetical protein [Microcoleus sp. FACHB-672]MBD2041303.1 hypothetical protein [Microcoleus sp. FACHB-672]
MISERFAAELNAVLHTQNRILQQLKAVVSDVEIKLADVSNQAQQIQELEKIMAELEASVEFLDEDDLSDFNPNEILRLYEDRRAAISQDLIKIGFKDWESFVKQCQISSLQYECNKEAGFQNISLAPYEALLTEQDFKKLRAESYQAQYAWDKWDYIFVGASGVLASLTDCLLVKIPATINTEEYSGQIGSPITAWVKQYDIKKSDDWFAHWARSLEKTCKVPYDNQKLIDGMYAKSHRFQSLGHDPVLGFVFGVLDIMRGTITGFSYDKLSSLHNFEIKGVPASETVGLIEAILRQIGHLISDVATPMGLPAPFMTLIQGINIGSFGEKNRTAGEVARWMYLNGYDFRHFLVSGITPAVIEIVLRAFIMLRHYSEYGETKFTLASHPKYRAMLLAAHGIAALGNAGKIALMQGNPLAINSAQWIALFRYLIPSIKYWVFDQHRLGIEEMEQVDDAGWDELMQNSDKLLEMVAKIEGNNICLGTVPILSKT